MIRKLIYGLTVLLAFGCATNEDSLRETLKRNPKIVFDLIEENPEDFIEVVNRAAQIAQRKHYDKQALVLRTEQENDLKEPKKPKLQEQRRLLGEKKSKIVIVEYADFQCPACRLANESLSQFKKKYKGEVQFYYKHMPLDFHKMALPAARYFEAIRLQDKEKAIRFFDFVFENQRELGDEGFLKKAAKTVGVNLIQLEKDVKSEDVTKIIEEDRDEFERFGFTGTPVIILNGVALHGAQKIEELERILNLTQKIKVR